MYDYEYFVGVYVFLIFVLCITWLHIIVIFGHIVCALFFVFMFGIYKWYYFLYLIIMNKLESEKHIDRVYRVFGVGNVAVNINYVRES